MDSRVNNVTVPKYVNGGGPGSSKNNLKAKGKAFKKTGNYKKESGFCIFVM